MCWRGKLLDIWQVILNTILLTIPVLQKMLCNKSKEKDTKLIKCNGSVTSHNQTCAYLQDNHEGKSRKDIGSNQALAAHKYCRCRHNSQVALPLRHGHSLLKWYLAKSTNMSSDFLSHIKKSLLWSVCVYWTMLFSQNR